MARGDGPSSRPAGSSAGGVLIVLYGVAAYLMFLVVFLYLIGFVADADFLVAACGPGTFSKYCSDHRLRRFTRLS